MFFLPSIRHIKSFFILFALLSCIIKVNGQTQNYLDSIENTLDTITNKESFATNIDIIRKGYAKLDIAKSIRINKNLIQTSPNKEFKGILYHSLGTMYLAQKNLDSAEFCLDSAVIIFDSMKDDTTLAKTYCVLGAIYTEQFNYEKAYSTIQKSIAICEEKKMLSYLAKNFMGLYRLDAITSGLMSNDMSNLKKAFDIFSEIKNHAGIARTAFDIATNYFFTLKTDTIIDDSAPLSEKADSCLFFFKKALHHFRINNNNDDKIVLSCMSIANFYVTIKKEKLALPYLEEALSREKFLKTDAAKEHLYSSLCQFYLLTGSYQKSINISKKWLTLEKSDMEEWNIYSILALAYAKLDSFERAYEFSGLAQEMSFKVLHKENIAKINSLKIEHETAQKEQENIILQKENENEKLKSKKNQLWIYILLGVSGFILLISILLLRTYKAQSAQKTSQLRHQLLRNQMNPHFFFNALIAIQSFMYENGLKSASIYLSRFAELMRAILENSRSEYIVLEKEIQWLENYLDLQALRFESKFDYIINLDPAIEISSTLIPPMLIQPFIENAIEHGILPLKEKGTITINYLLNEASIEVIIKDNGIGFDNSKNNSNHISLATTITKERLDYINKKQKNKIDFTIKSNEPKGTVVSFSIPLKLTT